MIVEGQTLTEMEVPKVQGLVPLSVIIHAHANPELLAGTVAACSENAGGCELELVLVHDHDAAAAVEECRRSGEAFPKISWQSIAIREEHDPRNLGAQASRYDHVLFLGDGVRPASEDFFRVHASLHTSWPERDFAVLGATENGDAFDLGHFLESGEQLASSYPGPSIFVNPCYFSDSNISIKKSLVQDWLTDGFSRDFPGPLGAAEFAYRLSKQDSRDLKILYDPTALATRERVRALSEMFQSQVQLGRLLRLFIDQYPEAAQGFGLESYVSGSKAPVTLEADYCTVIEGLKAWARTVDRRPGAQSESWHSAFALSILEVCLFQGFSAPGRLILDRFMRRLRLTLHDELAINAGPLSWGRI